MQTLVFPQSGNQAFQRAKRYPSKAKDEQSFPITQEDFD